MTRGPCSGVMVPALRRVGMPFPAALAFATHTMGPPNLGAALPSLPSRLFLCCGGSAAPAPR